MKIILNPKKCVGCGACVSICDKHFVIKEDQRSHLIDPESVAAEKETKNIETPDCSKDAADNCPVSAISIQ